MKTSDLLYAIFIVITFILLYVVNILAIGKKQIQNNWPIYRCNPMIMPFASLFGHDTMENFTYCVQNMQGDYMGNLMQPSMYNTQILSDSINNASTSTDFSRTFFSNIRTFTGGLFGTTMQIFSNLMIIMHRMVLGIKDMIAKTIGTVTTLMYILDGSIKTAESTWNGPPGAMIRAF